mgnify:CR=1 FL=1
MFVENFKIVKGASSKYVRCYDCKKGLDTIYNAYYRCKKCGGTKWEGMRRVSYWEAVRLFIMTRGKLLVIDSQWLPARAWRALKWNKENMG